ncbi:MAG TPA: recombinase family protein [Polyangiaceae bacterium]|nr:recombinase family protein [Polyangiaceae bacterium]
MKRAELPPNVLGRRAVVYVRQSTGAQVLHNLESQRQQYDLADLARAYGFRDVTVLDDDLGRSASGHAERPGFQALVGQLCEGTVGAVFCLEASRLARNGRDWHHLLELCGLVGARVIDAEGAYDPSQPNDRLLLGLKGTMSEFELTVLRRRLVEGARTKAQRGELRLPVPVGYLWSKESGLELDPDRRVQQAVRTVFRLFERLGSARQVLLHMRREGLTFPRPADGKRLRELAWRAPAYRNVIAVLRNPFYAGAYAYGKTEPRTRLADGRLRTTYGHERPVGEWSVLLHDHHAAYVSWAQYERNLALLARNTFAKPAGAAKSARGGGALLTSLLRCRRCGRMLQVAYSGRRLLRYACRGGHTMHGIAWCISFGSRRPDEAIAREILVAVQPAAVEAVAVAQREDDQRREERRRALELECEQARYDVRIAERRYATVDPDNRLVAAELEARWNAALERLRACEARLAAKATAAEPKVERAQLASLATDLEAAWRAPGVDMRVRQRLVRTLIEEIVVDVDEATREVVLVLHWRGGAHSEVRVRKPRPGEHTHRTSPEAGQVIRAMATKWSDEHVAATLNRMGSTTGQGHTWTAQRVGSYRRKSGIPGYESATKDGRCLTMVEAARELGVPSHVIRKLIQQKVLPARQVVFDAPWQILSEDLKRPEVQEALRRRRVLGGRPCRVEEPPRKPGKPARARSAAQ